MNIRSEGGSVLINYTLITYGLQEATKIGVLTCWYMYSGPYAEYLSRKGPKSKLKKFQMWHNHKFHYTGIYAKQAFFCTKNDVHIRRIGTVNVITVYASNIY